MGNCLQLGATGSFPAVRQHPFIHSRMQRVGECGLAQGTWTLSLLHCLAPRAFRFLNEEGLTSHLTHMQACGAYVSFDLQLALPAFTTTASYVSPQEAFVVGSSGMRRALQPSNGPSRSNTIGALGFIAAGTAEGIRKPTRPTG
jgi:hypothetical protein